MISIMTHALGGAGGLGRVARKVAGVLALAAAWEALARFALPHSPLLAAPSTIAARIMTDHALYARAFGVTLREAVQGFLIGNFTALALAASDMLVPAASGVVKAVALTVFCVPLVAAGPVLRAALGAGEGPQIVLSALGVYYATFLLLAAGLRAVPGVWPDLIASYGRGSWQIFWRVRLPASLPYLFAGLQIAAPAALLGAMVGEFTGADRGAGVLTLQAMRSLDTAGTWAVAVLASAIAVGGYVLAGVAARLRSAGAPPLLLASPPADARSAARSAAASVLTAAAASLVVLALWQGLMDGAGLSRFFAKRPLDVLAYLASGPMAGAHRAQLLAALVSTLAVTLPGYIAGLLLGLLLAVAAHLAPSASQLLTPAAIALRSIPIVVTTPLIVLAFGRGPAGMVAVVAAMTFFPTFVACLTGLRRTPGQVADVFATFAAARWQTLLWADLPAMAPSFLAAARMAVPAAVLAATVAEWLATGTGVGNLMAVSASTSKFGMLWSAVAALTALCLAGYTLVGMAERRVLRRFAPEQAA
jgi:ABC-type nitrate/sulfonate/bicarbonate transport system permease component